MLVATERMHKDLYKHYKGGLYRFLMSGYLEKDTELMAIYIDIGTGLVWIRPYSEFKEKFKKVRKEKPCQS